MSARWRFALAFAAGAALPWVAVGLQSAMSALGVAPPVSPALIAWAVAVVVVSTILGRLAGPSAVAVAVVAAVGGLAATAAVVVAYRLPLAWVLALWPQALAIAIALPLATITVARWRANRRRAVSGRTATLGPRREARDR